jgi:hypothetical protein
VRGSFLELAQNKKTGVKKRGLPKGKTNNPNGRPKAGLKFNPAAHKQKRQAPSDESLKLFETRDSAEKWIRGRLAKQVDDYDRLIDELNADLSANTEAIGDLANKGKEPTSVLMRGRQSTFASLRTLMAGQQELMVHLIKSRGLLGNLDDEDGGGDVMLNVHRLPPQRQAPPPVEKTPGDDVVAGS